MIFNKWKICTNLALHLSCPQKAKNLITNMLELIRFNFRSGSIIIFILLFLPVEQFNTHIKNAEHLGKVRNAFNYLYQVVMYDVRRTLGTYTIYEYNRQ